MRRLTAFVVAAASLVAPLVADARTDQARGAAGGVDAFATTVGSRRYCTASERADFSSRYETVHLSHLDARTHAELLAAHLRGSGRRVTTRYVVDDRRVGRTLNLTYWELTWRVGGDVTATAWVASGAIPDYECDGPVDTALGRPNEAASVLVARFTDGP